MDVAYFALLGLATGAIYALLAQGLVIVYRGSGLINFAQGGLALLGAYAYYDLSVLRGLPLPAAAALALAMCATVGALVHLLVLRPMKQASPLARVIATLGVLLILQATAFLVYGVNQLSVPSLLPTDSIDVHLGEAEMGVDRLLVVAVVLVVSVALFAVYRWTPFGRVTTAVAENELAASSLGYSPDVIAAVNWAVGSALAGLAGILLAPIIFLEPISMVLIVVPALAVALLARFSSFPLVFVFALALGVVQSEIARFVTQPGWATAAPFIVIIAWLAIRGRSLPLRSFVLDRLPAVGDGRIRPVALLVFLALGTWLAFGSTADWDNAMSTTSGAAIICLSVVLLTGYGGQLSLAQFVIAGVGALIAARLAAVMPVVPAVALGSIVAGLIGAAVGLPALRSRGATLAVATLGLASAIVALVFTNREISGGLAGVVIPPMEILGISIDPFLHPDRYAFAGLVVLAAVALSVANIRRGSVGRRLLAVRSNERAAASLGIPVAAVKTYAFGISGMIAAIGGVVMTFVQPTLQVSRFDVFSCIVIVAAAVLGGVGYVPGAIIGSLLVAGGIPDRLLAGWPQAHQFLPLIGGILLTLTLVTGANGSYHELATVGTRIRSRFGGRGVPRPQAWREKSTPRRASAGLQASHVTVAFGGVTALHDVSFSVEPGMVHGLIGPNGAGKTTLIDAMTGFVPLRSGDIRLGDEQIAAWSPRRRALAGLSRSFQSLELFDDLTIAENLAVASERPGLLRFFSDPIVPRAMVLSAAAVSAVERFHLEGMLGSRPSSISYGQRKLVAIARSIATNPSVLLLDEPAAGLDDVEARELGAEIQLLAAEWGIGILLVEHKVDMIMAVCDRVTVLQGGVVIATGTPAEIQARPEVLEAYLGTSIEAQR